MEAVAAGNSGAGEQAVALAPGGERVGVRGAA